MKGVSVREAQHNLARILRAVERGGTVEVTRRKIPVARIIPIKRGGGEAEWAGHRDRMRAVWGGTVVGEVGALLDELRGER